MSLICFFWKSKDAFQHWHKFPWTGKKELLDISFVLVFKSKLLKKERISDNKNKMIAC